MERWRTSTRRSRRRTRRSRSSTGILELRAADLQQERCSRTTWPTCRLRAARACSRSAAGRAGGGRTSGANRQSDGPRARSLTRVHRARRGSRQRKAESLVRPRHRGAASIAAQDRRACVTAAFAGCGRLHRHPRGARSGRASYVVADNELAAAPVQVREPDLVGPASSKLAQRESLGCLESVVPCFRSVGPGSTATSGAGSSSDTTRSTNDLGHARITSARGLTSARSMPHQLDRWMYRGGRPNRVARLLNGIWMRTAAAGLPPHRMRALEVRGRRSGRLRSFPVVVVVDHESQRYLVAMLGEGVNWASNLRDGRRQRGSGAVGQPLSAGLRRWHRGR